MITRPTTQQLLEDCARELRDDVIPAISDPTVIVNLQMMELVLQSCALRAGHEIAWMADEVAAIDAYVTDVAVHHAEVTAALAALRDAPSTSLHLADRADQYHLAGEALAQAVEACLAADDKALLRRGIDLLQSRRSRETELRPNFYFPGRS
jgi:hypothetical protein